jgi:hypothetical protein
MLRHGKVRGVIAEGNSVVKSSASPTPQELLLAAPAHSTRPWRAIKKILMQKTQVMHGNMKHFSLASHPLIGSKGNGMQGGTQRLNVLKMYPTPPNPAKTKQIRLISPFCSSLGRPGFTCEPIPSPSLYVSHVNTDQYVNTERNKHNFEVVSSRLSSLGTLANCVE